MVVICCYNSNQLDNCGVAPLSLKGNVTSAVAYSLALEPTKCQLSFRPSIPKRIRTDLNFSLTKYAQVLKNVNMKAWKVPVHQ